MCLTTEIAAPAERVWRALTVPDEVSVWDGVAAIDVAADYPQPGQHARWRSALGPLRLTLHDRISAVEPEQRMAAEIDIAFVHVDEEYVLLSHEAGHTMLVTDDDVRSHIPGLGWLAVRLTRANVAASMARLKEYCEHPVSTR